jgi:hypothetical protein
MTVCHETRCRVCGKLVPSVHEDGQRMGHVICASCAEARVTPFVIRRLQSVIQDRQFRAQLS